jgi:Zn-dependent protease with chaperone function
MQFPKARKASLDAKELERLFSGMAEFPKPRVTLAHRAAVLLVAGTMLVLPLLYFAFTAGVVWLTWWHTTHNYVWMSVPGGRTKLFAFVGYAGLAVGGVLWVLSLIRPLFTRFRGESAEEGLSREDEPVLFAFADRLAENVGSPRPEIIHLDLDVNASASYETKMFGLGRKAFTLTLGIPLVAGLTLAQLAGVIAHEFGHFSQRGSTLLDRLIRRVNLWFALAVHRRDVVDEVIESVTDSEDGNVLLALVGFLLWILVGLGRIVLWCLMQIGLFVSSSLLRRMEFDADRYEIAVVGTNVFEETSRRIVELSVAHAFASRHVFDSMRGDYLPDDYAGFVAGLANKSRRVQKKARKLIKKEKSSWLASHPPTRARIRAAEKLDQPGVLHSKRSSSALFRNFQQKSKGLTNLLYEIRYNDSYAPETRRSTREAVETYVTTMEKT